MGKRDASHFITEYYTEGGKVELMIPTDATDDDFALLREMLDLIEAKLKRRADRKTEPFDKDINALCKTEPQTEIPEYAEWKNAYEKMSNFGEREGE